MTTFRIASLTVSPVAVAPKLRISSVRVPSAVTPKLRIASALLTGPLRVKVLDIPAVTVEPLDTVSVVTNLEAGLVADSYTWRQISGDTVTLVGSGANRTFVAPANPVGASVVLGVTATKDSITSAETQATITVLPQTEWVFVGGVVVPSKLIAIGA